MHDLVVGILLVVFGLLIHAILDLPFEIYALQIFSAFFVQC